MATALLLLLVSGEVVETKHYILDAPDNVAQEYARILEAAHPQFEKFFKAKLKPKTKSKKLPIRFFATSEEMRRAALADGARSGVALTSQYVVASQTAYGNTQNGVGVYGARVSLLRAAATQYHWLARMKNKAPKASWWQLGIPDYLAQHHWDGTTLKLGVRPVIGRVGDYPSQALTAAKGFDLWKFVADEKGPLQSRKLAWAFVRFLLHGNQGRPFKGYDKWARKMDGRNTPLDLFKKTYGRDNTMQQTFLPWLEAQQPLYRQVQGDWFSTSADSVQGSAKARGALLLPAEAKAVEAVIRVPQKGRWLAGALLHYSSADDYTVALLDWGGFIRIQRWQKTRWQMMERGQGPPKSKDGNYHVQIFRKKGKTYLMIGTMDGYGPWDIPAEGIGFAIEKTKGVVFEKIRWK